MSADVRWLEKAIPEGKGLALDLGGGQGTLHALVEKKGWRYVNLDIRPGKNPFSVCGDAHNLPFKDSVFSLVVAKDSLEHFERPWVVVREVWRILLPGGIFVIWVPFMWPFHGDDFYRYTPLAFERLLRGFRIVKFDTPFWVFSVIGLVVTEIAKWVGFGFLERPIRELTWRLDRLFQPSRSRPHSFAGAYLIVAEKTLMTLNH